MIPEAEDEVVKSAHLTLTSKYKSKGDSEKVKQIKQAYVEIGKARGWLQALNQPDTVSSNNDSESSDDKVNTPDAGNKSVASTESVDASTV